MLRHQRQGAAATRWRTPSAGAQSAWLPTFRGISDGEATHPAPHGLWSPRLPTLSRGGHVAGYLPPRHGVMLAHRPTDTDLSRRGQLQPGVMRRARVCSKLHTSLGLAQAQHSCPGRASGPEFSEPPVITHNQSSHSGYRGTALHIAIPATQAPGILQGTLFMHPECSVTQHLTDVKWEFENCGRIFLQPSRPQDP